MRMRWRAKGWPGHRPPPKEPKTIGFYKQADGSPDRTPRVLLVFPIFTHVLPQAFHAFAAMLLKAARDCPTYKFDVMLCERELLHSAMNRAAEACLFNLMYVGMIAFDDDCLPPGHTIPRLMAHYEHGHHIVAGYGFMRNYPHTTTVGRLHKEGPILEYDQNFNGMQRGFYWLDDIAGVTPDAHGLIAVDFCGMPAMFVSRQVLQKVEKPYFAHQDGTGATTTHDIYFCNKAKDAGFAVEVDVTLECAHIGPAPLITSETRTWARKASDVYDDAHRQPPEQKAG